MVAGREGRDTAAVRPARTDRAERSKASRRSAKTISTAPPHADMARVRRLCEILCTNQGERTRVTRRPRQRSQNRSRSRADPGPPWPRVHCRRPGRAQDGLRARAGSSRLAVAVEHAASRERATPTASAPSPQRHHTRGSAISPSATPMTSPVSNSRPTTGAGGPRRPDPGRRPSRSGCRPHRQSRRCQGERRPTSPAPGAAPRTSPRGRPPRVPPPAPAGATKAVPNTTGHGLLSTGVVSSPTVARTCSNRTRGGTSVPDSLLSVATRPHAARVNRDQNRPPLHRCGFSHFQRPS